MNLNKLLSRAKLSENKSLNENESKQLLKNYGIPVVNEKIALNENEALNAAKDIGFPVVIKGMGQNLLHKTEQGLVWLNLKDASEVKNAVSNIKTSAKDDLQGLLVQPQLAGTREFVAGLFRDNQFGPVIMFGLGGIFTEAFSDVSFRLAPLEEADALEMLNEIKAQKLFGNFRGQERVNKKQLIQILMSLSEIAVNHPEISEIDINPLLVQPSGEICAVDALIILRQQDQNKQFLPPVDPVLIGNLFYPKSIAFVGASSQLGKWGHNLMSITISRGYKKNIWLVNSKGGTIAGRHVYKSVNDVPESIDLAVVTIPASGVIDLIPQFKEKGIKNMLLITSGFAETGDNGKKLEQELMDKAREAGILILGPNTMGICNPHVSLYCTGSHVWPEPGHTSVVAQSGNMGTQLLAFAEKQGIGIRCFSGSGNEGMIAIEDYMEGFEIDKVTRNIMLYLESIKNGRRFFETAKRIGKKKPIILLKGGRTKAGTKAAASHTGAMSSDTKIFNAMCKQTGIIKVEYPMDMMDLSAAFSSLPLPKGNKAAIMTLGGGWGVVTADLCSDFNLKVPDLSDAIIERINTMLPPYWSKSNPVDVVGEFDNDMAVNILEELMKWDGCDAVITLGMIGRKNLLTRVVDSVQKADPSYQPDALKAITKQVEDFETQYMTIMAELMEKYQKPIFGVCISFDKEEKTVQPIKGHKLKCVVYTTPERAVKTFAKMYEYYKFLKR